MPPFDDPVAAAMKVRYAEDMWNSRDAHRISHGYTHDTQWRNRGEFLRGRDEVRTPAFTNGMHYIL